MSLYDMNAVNVAAEKVTDENMFHDFRQIQLFAMSLIAAVEAIGVLPPDDDKFDSRVIRENIPAGMQTRLTPVAVLTDVEMEDGSIEQAYVYHYDETLEIIEIGA